MFPANYRYHRAESFAAASAALQAFGTDAKLLAGGQTLIPMMKLRLVKPSHLIDIGRLATGHAITGEGAVISIGALATHASVGTSDLARTYPVFADCGLGIADVQVRNMGTLGGSLAEADPSSCWPTLLLALGARVRCLGPDGERVQTVRSLLKDAYTPALDSAELITSVEIDRAALEGHGAFVAFKRAAPAYPTASCALQVAMDGERVRSVRLALGCVALTPIVIDGVQAILQGNALNAKKIDEAGELAAQAAEPVDDNKGSEAYKRSLIQGLVRRAFSIAQSRRAGQPHAATHTYYG